MKRIKWQSVKYLIILYLVISPFLLSAQNINKHRVKKIEITNSIIKYDTLSTIPSKTKVKDLENKNIDTSKYSLDFNNSIIEIKDTAITSIVIDYYVFDIDFSKKYKIRDTNIIVGKISDYNIFFEDNSQNNEIKIIDNEEIYKEGQISRGISIGNNQDLSLNSNLDLKLSGKINDEMSVIASITDDNIPIQADGNTQQIQDFDNVFINIFNDKTSTIVGDFEKINEESYFLEYTKKVKGIDFKYFNSDELNKKIILSNENFGIALGKGIYHKVNISGDEGNQGPYKLTGKNNEKYIIILSNSEKVYIDGILQTRGENYDYTVDYNAAEITFTSKNLITKDKRIIVEFEYSQQNYTRFLFFNSTEITNNKNNIKFDIYSENDAKNQPLQYNFSAQQIEILNQIGDNIDEAVVEKIDSVEFDKNLILYKKVDSLINNAIYSDIYVFSSNPEEAKYLLSFSEVGENNGNYILKSNLANGRVYEWIAPEQNIPQGNYEPVVLLITPKKKQIYSLSGNSKINEKNFINYDFALNTNDLNTFSNFDDEDNNSFAIKINSSNFLLGNPNSDKYFKIVNDYSFVDKKFETLEDFREPEFDRNWNLSENKAVTSENIINSSCNYYNSQFGTIFYMFSLLNRFNSYNGIKNTFNIEITKNRIYYKQLNTFLNSKDYKNEESKTFFFTNSSIIETKFRNFNIGLNLQNENNKFINSKILTDLSFSNNQIGFFINNPDTSNYEFLAEVLYRDDLVAHKNDFLKVSNSYDYSFKFGNSKEKNNNYSISVIYRELFIKDTFLTETKPEKNLLGVFENNLKLYKSAIVSSLRYETGSGLEQKKEYLFVEVNAGQGMYVWNDYNKNEIKELNEFEIANYFDEANYLKVFTQSNDYIKIYNSKLSYILLLNPQKYFKNEKSIKKILSYFINTTTIKNEQKFQMPIFPLSSKFLANDSSVITSVKNIRNVLSVNKNGIIAVDYKYLSQINNSILINGSDEMSNKSNSIIFYINLFDTYIFSNSITKGLKQSKSEYLLTKNYTLDFIENEIKLDVDINSDLDFSLKYIFKKQTNIISTEKSRNNLFGVEFSYSLVENTNFFTEINFVNIKFNSDYNTSVAYIMLESLKPGNNLTWNANIQKNILNNLQLSLYYEGRFSENESVIHSGNFQIKALF